MQSYSQSYKPRVAIEIDADLIEWIDQLMQSTTEPSEQVSAETIEQNRARAIEEAIQLWCQQQANRRLQRLADQHHQRHKDDETGWLV